MRTAGCADFVVTDGLEEIAMNLLSSRAKRSGVEGPRGTTDGNATGFLDFARNDGEEI